MIKRNKIIANINYQYLDVTLNENIGQSDKQLPNAFHQKKSLYVSPFFSKEIFRNTNLDKHVNSFAKPIIKKSPPKKKKSLVDIYPKKVKNNSYKIRQESRKTMIPKQKKYDRRIYEICTNS